MASTQAYLSYVLEQLSELEELRFRAMMGEYILYVRGKVVGGVYDDRLLLKPTKSALKLTEDCGRALAREIPYDGAKPMLLADIDDGEFTACVIQAIAEDLH